MGRRRILAGMADGTLTAFVGRNFELSHYWAMGVLCRHVLEQGLVDDRGAVSERSTEGWCWPHNPARESRSVGRDET